MLESADIYTTWRTNGQISFSPQASAKDGGDAALLDQFRHVEVASVSDSLEQVAGKRMFMSHHMRSIFPTKFAGFAVTVLLKKAENNNDPAALNGMLASDSSVDRTQVNKPKWASVA